MIIFLDGEWYVGNVAQIWDQVIRFGGDPDSDPKMKNRLDFGADLNHGPDPDKGKTSGT